MFYPLPRAPFASVVSPEKGQNACNCIHRSCWPTLNITAIDVLTLPVSILGAIDPSGYRPSGSLTNGNKLYGPPGSAELIVAEQVSAHCIMFRAGFRSVMLYSSP
jgi:hypothetical protein